MTNLFLRRVKQYSGNFVGMGNTPTPHISDVCLFANGLGWRLA